MRGFSRVPLLFLTEYCSICLFFFSFCGKCNLVQRQVRAATFMLHFTHQGFFFLKRLTGKEKRVGGYDLMWNDGPVYREDVSLETFGGSSCTANTHLGNLVIGRSKSFGEETDWSFSGVLFPLFFLHTFNLITHCCAYFIYVLSAAGCVNDREKQLRWLLKPFPGQKRL